MKIGIVAGETSGDYLGSELIKAIKQQIPDATFIGIAGPLMQQQGMQSLADMHKLSIFGLEGLLGSIFEILKIRRNVYEQCLEHNIDVFIGIDAPDFNLKLERKFKQQGITAVHYVSPTVWAWRGGRIHKIKKSIDLMLTLFPFEENYYQQHNAPVKYVGHPLAKQVLQWQEPEGFKQSLVNNDQKLVVLLPGSRVSEVKRLAPEMLGAAAILAEQDSSLRFVVPVANAKVKNLLEELVSNQAAPIKLIDGHSRDLLSVADYAAIASGTAALEAALFACPMVVMYKVSGLSAFIWKNSITVEHFSMPNHLTDPPAVPELIQDRATAENLVTELTKLMQDDDYKNRMVSALSAIAPALNENSGQLAAEAILKLVKPVAGEQC